MNSDRIGHLTLPLAISKPIILTFVRYYLPGYKSGGPVRSIANMVEALGDEFEFRVVTSDRDFLDAASYDGITPGAWTAVGKAWVHYVLPERRTLLYWVRLMRETSHHVVYLNSLFDPVYTVMPLLARRIAGLQDRPLIIAPRGELSPGAMGLKRWKKRSFLAVAQRLGIFRNVLWHASTGDEAFLIRRRFSSTAKVVIARNLSAPLERLEPSCSARNVSGPLRIVFLSRVTRMKNLDYALRILAKTAVPIQFDIWGIVDDPPYWEVCQGLIKALPEHVVARYLGPADHADVNKILASYDLLFLPSQGENYGHVIAEALSVGTPVLLSDRTPWRNLRHEGVGWDLPLENGEAAFLEAIEESFRKVEAERAAWRQRVLDFARARLDDPSLREANRSLFLQAIAGDGRLN